MKPFTKISSVILALVALAHLVRLLQQVPVTIGTEVIPMWVSVPGLLVTASLSIGLWRESKY